MIIKANKYTTINSALSLLIFSIILDPSDSILKIKNILFFYIMIVYIFTFKSYKKIAFMTILFLYLVFILSVTFGQIRNYDFDNTMLFAYLKGWIFYLLLFVAFNHHFSFFSKLIFPCVIMSLVMITLYILIKNVPHLESVLLLFFVNQHDKMINITHRRFLDVDIIGIYYKTAPILILPLAYYTNLFLRTPAKRLFNFILSALFYMALSLTGTRASMFSASFVVGLLLIKSGFKNIIGRLILIPCLIFFMIFSINILQKLLNEKDYSINVKTKHLYSQVSLFEEHPDILIFGQGIGSIYYSSGANGMIPLSELSYIEILRMFGFIGGFIVFLFHIFPIFIIYNNKPSNYDAFILGYIIYLIIAGTNPLIINSFGNLVVFTAFSYAFSKRN